MPYDYRKPSPEEKEAVLQQRRAHGYPLHPPPHPYKLAGRYLLTAANFEHAPIMADIERRTDFEARVLAGLREAASAVLAWVMRPNHYHVLVEAERLAVVAPVLMRLHGRTSREWNQADQQTGRRRVWYHYRDRWIRDQVHLYRALNDVHHNPVKHGYTADPYDWPWSSIHNYLVAYGRAWLREQWRLHPPGDFGKGWDD